MKNRILETDYFPTKIFQDLVEISPFPFSEIDDLREKYTYNITPWSQGIAAAKKGLKILYR